MTKKQELRVIERTRDKLEGAIAEKVAERDHYDDLVDRKRDREPKRADRRDELDAEIAGLDEQIRKLNKRIPQLRSRRSELARKAKKLARQLRNRAKPKVIDLNLSFDSMATQGSIVRVIGHHTAGPTDDDDADAIRLCKTYHAAHRAQDWAGEGYGLNFTRNGSIILLRPLGYVGAHTLNNNYGSLGIMCHGTTGDQPTKLQAQAMRWWAKNGHKRMPKSHRATVRPKNVPWFGHLEFNATACPGTHLTLYQSKGKKR